MSAKYSYQPRRSSGSNSSQEALIGILVLIVIVETFLLLRPYIKKKGEHAPAHKKTVSHALRPEPWVPKPEPVIPPAPLPAAPAARIPPGKGMIAIIIDDNGYNASDCDRLAAIPQPVAVAILPDLKYSKEMGYCAHQEGKEVMLHLPLEPHVNHERYPEDYIIKTKMPEAAILAKLNECLKNVPHAQGVNNHMGSKATEDQRLMSIILADLKARGLFFVDSVVTNKSVCLPIARKLDIPFTYRDVFLDNINTRAAIEAQFVELARKANRQGKAVGIGHARPLTWQIVKEQLEKLSRAGYQIVTVNAIIHSPAP